MKKGGEISSGGLGVRPADLPAFDYRGVRSHELENDVGPIKYENKPIEARYMRRYRELKKELIQIEKENQAIVLELRNSRARVERLKFEKELLLERLRETTSATGIQPGGKRSMKMYQDLDYRGIDPEGNQYYRKYNYGRKPYCIGSSNFLCPSEQDIHGRVSKKLSPDSDTWDCISIGNSVNSGSSLYSGCSLRYNTVDDHVENMDLKDGQLFAPHLLKKSKRQKSKERDPNAPKRPSNAFMYFCEMQREILKKEREALDEQEQEKTGLNNLTKALGSRWQALTEEERREWREQFLAKVEKYYSDLKCYRGNNSEFTCKPQTTDKEEQPLESLCYTEDQIDKKPQKESPTQTVKNKTKTQTREEQTKQPDHSQEGSPQPNTTQEPRRRRDSYDESMSFTSQSELSDPDPNILEQESDSIDHDVQSRESSLSLTPV